MSDDRRELALALYRTMLLLRAFDRAAVEAAARKEIHGGYSDSRGSEAVSVGICSALSAQDVVYPGLHGIGDLLAMGTDPRLAMAELFGKATGLNGGRGGRLHLIDVERNVMGVSGVLAAAVPMAAGNALAARRRKNGVVTVCFVGDRATNQGIFHETLNLVGLWRLPLLLVGVNNAPDDSTTPVAAHTAAGSLVALAQVHGFKTAAIDATDVFTVYDIAREVLARIRAETVPFFLECQCYPLDQLSRPETLELQDEWRRAGKAVPFSSFKRTALAERGRHPPIAWREGDPVQKLEATVHAERLADDETLAGIRRDVEAVVDDAVEFARRSPQPVLQSALQGVFKSPSAHLTGGRDA